ncbi:E3 ubiquitin-protein ligase MARCHF8 isoform X2 [Rosa chinensis]|uniref:E3 ubiquitin-protein ligase MARCHF8 isoform X2 n=1 Tax=Rosa chinensis TaxID=74649 RepID=UPI000D08AFF8|nr:E3 ubiquitin-protein ligase MARCHF8 isoform X2 [Rosa chinensis]
MQLVLNDGREEDNSECEPILSQSENAQRSSEASSSCEITAVLGDIAVTDEESQNLDVNESSKLVISEQPQCRICLDNEGEDLIAPCHCRGTQKYVHRSCLDNWRSTKEGFAFAHCTECREVFILRANVPPDRWWLRLKFQFLVARDHAFIFIIVQLIVAFLGVMVYKFYGEELREMFGYEEHPYGFYTMAGMLTTGFPLKYLKYIVCVFCHQH